MHLGRFVICLAPMLLLAACGVDGPPEPPEPREERPAGVTATLSGEANVGVIGRS